MSKTWVVGLLVLSPEQVATALRNNIPRHVVYSRINDLDWSIDRALTKPVKIRKEKRYTKQDVKDAAANGISYNTFITRFVTRNWNLLEAKTKPIVKPCPPQTRLAASK